MSKVYRDEVIVRFNPETNKWELIYEETGEVIDTGSSVVCLVNSNDCLR